MKSKVFIIFVRGFWGSRKAPVWSLSVVDGRKLALPIRISARAKMTSSKMASEELLTTWDDERCRGTRAPEIWALWLEGFRSY